MILTFLPTKGQVKIASSQWKHLFVFTLLMTTAYCTAIAQGVYSSANNKTANWESASTWTKTQSWMAEPSTMTSVGGSDQFTVNGYITRNGNLGVTGSGGLMINDTLVIVGNLTMTTSTGITVGPSGLLIVLGDFYSSGGGNKINVQGNGRVAIVGNYEQEQGSVTTGNAFYIYDDTPEFTSGGCNGGASVDGVNYGCPNNTTTLTNFMEDEQDLHNNDVPLEEFLESLGVTCGFANLNTSAAQAICTGSTPAQLTGAAISPGTYLWESSTTSATTGFSTAGGTSNTQNYTPAALTQTTWFRRKVTRSGCTNTSPTTIVTIEPNGTWRGTSNGWGTAANWCGGVPTPTTDVVIKTTSTGNYPTITATANAHNISITTGTSVSLTSNNTLNVYGSVTNSGTWTTTGGTVAFVGNAAQTVSGGPFTFNNLSINNSSAATVSFGGAVTVTGTLTVNNTSGAVLSINGAANVSGTLTMTAGKVNLNGNTLTLGTAGNSLGTLTNPVGATSWIYNGTMSRWVPSNASIANDDYRGYFPMGSASDFRPLWVSYPTPASNRPSTAGTIRVTHAANNTTNTVSIIEGGFTIGARQNSSWSITTGNSLNGGTFNLKMGGTNFGTIASTSDLRIMRAASVAPGSNGTASGLTSNFLAMRSTISFANLAGAYYIGSVNASATPMPVKLISFTAAPANTGISIDWKSVSEENFDYYELQRAGEDLVFAPLARIENKGGYNLTATYNHIDTQPFNGKNYYRLKSVDVDGTFEYSTVAWATWEFSELSAYPNPVVGKKFTLQLQDLPFSPVAVIMNSRGKEILRIAVSSGRQEISLPEHMDAGIYYLRIQGISKVIKLSVQ